MKPIAQVLVLLAGLIALPSAWGISHIGGGKVKSSQSGFVSSLGDSRFLFDSSYPGGLLVRPLGQALGSTVLGHQFEPSLFLVDSSQVWPEFAPSTMEEAKEQLGGLGWQYEPHPNPCVLGMTRQSDSAVSHVMLWGPRRGVIVSHPTPSPMARTAERVVGELELLEGACQWK